MSGIMNSRAAEASKLMTEKQYVPIFAGDDPEGVLAKAKQLNEIYGMRVFEVLNRSVGNQPLHTIEKLTEEGFFALMGSMTNPDDLRDAISADAVGYVTYANNPALPPVAISEPKDGARLAVTKGDMGETLQQKIMAAGVRHGDQLPKELLTHKVFPALDERQAEVWPADVSEDGSGDWQLDSGTTQKLAPMSGDRANVALMYTGGMRANNVGPRLRANQWNGRQIDVMIGGSVKRPGDPLEIIEEILKANEGSPWASSINEIKAKVRECGNQWKT